jgi:hypothetical protein
VITPDLEETARLILMEDDAPTGLVAFRRRLQENTSDPDQVGIYETKTLWTRYRGFDGRVAPTHDVETGRRL